MKRPVFLAEQEIGAIEHAPMLANMINTRFVGFLAALSKKLGLPKDRVSKAAVEVLKEADIPQGDENVL